jgi:hypothetical protein
MGKRKPTLTVLLRIFGPMFLGVAIGQITQGHKTAAVILVGLGLLFFLLAETTQIFSEIERQPPIFHPGDKVKNINLSGLVNDIQVGTVIEGNGPLATEGRLTVRVSWPLDGYHLESARNLVLQSGDEVVKPLDTPPLTD